MRHLFNFNLYLSFLQGQLTRMFLSKPSGWRLGQNLTRKSADQSKIIYLCSYNYLFWLGANFKDRFNYDVNLKHSRGKQHVWYQTIFQILLTNFPLFRLEISTKFFRTNYYRHCRRRWRRTTPTKPPRRFRRLGLRSPESLWITLLEMSKNCKLYNPKQHNYANKMNKN